MGVVECAKHELLTSYPVLYEKDGEFVAQIKYTVLLMPNGPLRFVCSEFFRPESAIEQIVTCVNLPSTRMFSTRFRAHM